MALRKLERRNYGGKLPVSKSPFQEGLILLYQSILETRRMTNLNGSAHFTIPLSTVMKIIKNNALTNFMEPEII